MSQHTESKLFKDLKKAIPEADLVRHEDRISLGVPDVSYSYKVHGWIELKQGQWPANRRKSVNFSHPLTPQQKKFLKTKDLMVGHTFILAWIGDEYLWFLGRDSYQLGILTQMQLKRLAVAYTVRLDDDIYDILIHTYPS